MPISFVLTERLAGYAASEAGPGQTVQVVYRALIGPAEPVHLQQQLEQLQGALFSKIPGLPVPSRIDHILVLIAPDLRCTAYVNELNIKEKVKANREVEAGTLVFASDITDVAAVDLGVEIPVDHAVVFVRSFGWKRSLFFDFGPASKDLGPRSYPIEQAFAQQSLGLLGLPPMAENEPAGGDRIREMSGGLERLRGLIADRSEQEADYQTLLEQYPWMLGSTYSRIYRHLTFDDKRIPDFTALRCYDDCHDIVELKQPFLKLFRQDGGFSSAFNDAWNQAEGYLSFAIQQRSYLLEEKQLRFENPKCILIIGHELNDAQLRAIRKKEGLGRVVSVITYDQLVRMAEQVLSLVNLADSTPLSSVGTTIQQPMSHDNDST